MRKLKEVKVIEDVPVEILASAIRDISIGIDKIKAGPLEERAILLLVQHAAPAKRGNVRYSLKDVADILQGLDNLKSTYLKPVKKGKS